jgi:hypothetical protein
VATHALTVTGTGGTAALARTIIGAAVTFPAGGPWNVQFVWGQVAKVTTLPSEGSGGILEITAPSGDISPSPAPAKFPLIGSPQTSSANSSTACLPLNLWEVDWMASGKSTMEFYYINQLAITTGSQLAGGVIFGTERPQVRPAKFCDYVQTSWAAAAEQTVGTITLAEKATRITGIMADLNKGDALTTGEEIMATIRLDSDDILLPPANYPCCRCFDAGDGTVAGESAVPRCDFIPVDIPVQGGARITCYATSTRAVTGNCDIIIYIAYE